jgi:hypothetical protein
MDNVAEQSGQLYGDLRRWIPKHPTAVTVFASTAVGLGVAGYLMGRSRTRPVPQSRMSSALSSISDLRMPELGMAPFFKFLSLWMLYRVATRD